MAQLKKIDYRKIEEEKEEMSSEQTQAENTTSGLAAIKSRWDFMDKKVKIEVIIFTLVIVGIISMFSLYLYNKQPSYDSDEFYDESMVDDFMPIDEEGQIEP
jgi:hypothetical protein